MKTVGRYVDEVGATTRSEAECRAARRIDVTRFDYVGRKGTPLRCAPWRGTRRRGDIELAHLNVLCPLKKNEVSESLYMNIQFKFEKG